MTPPMVKRFKVVSIEGPTDRGRLNQFHDYLIEIELDLGESYFIKRVRAAIRLDDNKFYSLTRGAPEHSKARLAYYIKEKFKSILIAHDEYVERVFEPTGEEVFELQSIDSARVTVADWISIPEPNTDSSKKGSQGVNIIVTNGDLNIGGDVVGKDKTTDRK